MQIIETHIFEIIEIVVILFLAVISFRLWRSKTERTPLKDIQIVVGILTFLVAGHIGYVEFIQKRIEKKKLPPALSINCKLEKVAETDSCYWIKVSINYHNKGERRVYILHSEFNIRTIHVLDDPKEFLNTSFRFSDNASASKYFTYFEDTSAFYSRKIDADTSTWLDPNQNHGHEFIVKAPYGKDIASLTMNVNLANVEVGKIKGYKIFSTFLKQYGTINFTIVDESNGEVSTEDLLELRDLYGLCSTSSTSQIYLKDNSLKK